jgi:hypothetical protein
MAFSFTYKERLIRITDFDHDSTWDGGDCGLVTAQIAVDGRTAPFAEYEIEGRLDDSVDCGWSAGGMDEELEALLVAEFGADDAESVQGLLYKKINPMITGTAYIEEEVEKALEERGFRLMGQDPYRNDWWHVGIWIDSDTSTTFMYQPSLGQVMSAFKDESFFDDYSCETDKEFLRGKDGLFYQARYTDGTLRPDPSTD